MVKVANDIGVTISKQDFSVCHCLPSRYPGSCPIMANFFRGETEVCVMTFGRTLKNSSRKNYKNVDVSLLQAKIAKALRQCVEVKFFNMCNEKLILTMSNDKRHIFENLLV